MQIYAQTSRLEPQKCLSGMIKKPLNLSYTAHKKLLQNVCFSLPPLTLARYQLPSKSISQYTLRRREEERLTLKKQAVSDVTSLSATKPR